MTDTLDRHVADLCARARPAARAVARLSEEEQIVDRRAPG